MRAKKRSVQEQIAHLKQQITRFRAELAGGRLSRDGRREYEDALSNALRRLGELEAKVAAEEAGCAFLQENGDCGAVPDCVCDADGPECSYYKPKEK